MQNGSFNLLTTDFYYSFGMPRFDMADTTDDKKPTSPDDKKVDEPKGTQDKKLEDMTADELRQKLMVVQNTANSQNDKVTRVQNDYQKLKDQIKDFEKREADAKKAAEDDMKKKQEFEPLLEAKEQEIADLKSRMDQLSQDQKDSIAQMEKNNLQNIVHRSLVPLIREDLVKEKDPVKAVNEAMKFYDLDKLELDDSKEPTNLDEINKAFLDAYPGLAKPDVEATPGNGNILGPGSSTNIPTDGITGEHKAIAAHVNLPPTTIKRRLEGADKERWKLEYAYITRGMEENKVFK